MDKETYKSILQNQLLNKIKADTTPSEASENTSMQDTQEERIIQTGSAGYIPNEISDIHCMTVIGQIEGHMVLPSQNKTTKYEHIIPQLIAVEESSAIKGLLLILNTVGGDVEAGLAIAEMISTMTTPVVSLVLGGGHSIGVPLAVSARYSFIAPTAAMTIHPIRINGLFIGSPQTYDYMNKMQERIVGFITEHSRLSRDELSRLMLNTGDIANEIGTVLIGKEAVDCGLINETGGLSQALSMLRMMINEKKGGVS